MVVGSVEALGQFSALSVGALNREPTTEELSHGLIANGLSTLLGGFFGGLPTSTFGQNVGIVITNKVVNRAVIGIAACFLLIAGFVPKISAILLSIPSSVLGGATISVFATITMTGIRLFTTDGLTMRTQAIVGISAALGMSVEDKLYRSVVRFHCECNDERSTFRFVFRAECSADVCAGDAYILHIEAEYLCKMTSERERRLYRSPQMKLPGNIVEPGDRDMEDQAAAIEQLYGMVKDPSKLDELKTALELCVKMAPITPNHHFYIDQGIYARMRLMFRSIGEKYAEAGILDDPEDIFMAVMLTGNGYKTTLFAVNDELQQKSIELYDSFYKDLIEKKLVTPAQAEACREYLSYTQIYEGIADCEVVFECVFENVEAKHGVYKDIEANCTNVQAIVSTTSALSAEDLVGGLDKYKGKMVVAHPFNPPHLVPYVELVKSPVTEEGVPQLVYELLESAGRKVVVLKKSAPGFIANRLQHG